ncbi:hypothetical protein QOT17_000738 [Balamuthia mandrillaris]
MMETVGQNTPSSRQAIEKALSSFRANSPIFPDSFHHVVYVKWNATIPEVMKVLKNNGLTSVPIVHDDFTLVGVVSVLDLLMHFYSVFTVEELEREDFVSIWSKKKALESRNISDIAGLGTKDPLVTTTTDSTIWDVLLKMVSERAHRVVVYDPANDNRLCNVITQSRVLKLISCMMDAIPKAKQTLRQLNLGFKKVYTISEDEKTYKAFQQMHEKKISGLAVVDNEGFLVGNVSASDINKLDWSKDDFGKEMGKPLSKFIKQMPLIDASESSLIGATTDAHSRGFAITCNPDHTLHHVINMLVFYRIHHIFITQNQNRRIQLLGHLSLVDVLDALIQE